MPRVLPLSELVSAAVKQIVTFLWLVIKKKKKQQQHLLFSSRFVVKLLSEMRPEQHAAPEAEKRRICGGRRVSAGTAS